ncbi:hypothetical protein F4820DRAFT_449953 [Hypoxylon rubiginosum]|uniref:Uncharacterized protein n=1 Tax=Hypoxylon rubiginosum TaxID=110542 RepID=A0ACB9YXP5_9PEZI|nr:hypothetical protein F4820DRAFT_449953 [Hypoxylon rubiginosum]
MTGSILSAPEGIGAETLAASIILCVIAIVTVILRLCVRVRIGALGRDDYTMIIALAFFIPCCVISVLGCLSGFGATEEAIQKTDPSGGLYRDGRKYFFIFQIAYLGCLPFIKLSICFALLRITDAKRYVVPLWLVLGLTVLMSGVGLVTLMTQCKPLSASFNPTPDKCSGGSGTRLGWVTITISGFSMLTDWMYAAIPVFILWNLNMKTKVKASLAFILALGALASVSTIVKLPYIIQYFFEPAHTLQQELMRHIPFHTGKTASIIVWSIVETGIGIIAGSLPPLRPLFRRIGFGFGATRRLKLTYEDPQLAAGRQGDNGDSAGVSKRKSRASVLATGSPHHHNHTSVRLASIKKKAGGSRSHGNSLTTTCQGGMQERRGSWDRQMFDEEEGSDGDGDVPNHQKLVIMKNTQIDIEFEAADGSPLPLGK